MPETGPDDVFAIPDFVMQPVGLNSYPNRSEANSKYMLHDGTVALVIVEAPTVHSLQNEAADMAPCRQGLPTAKMVGDMACLQVEGIYNRVLTLLISQLQPH